MTLTVEDIRRLPLGHYTRPAGDPLAGRRIVVDAYLTRHPGGLLLFDSGIGEGAPEFDRHYRVVRRPLRDGLAALGAGLADVRLVVNCHLHADHCGGNPALPGRPVFVQRAELEAARGPDYTIPSLVDFTGAAYELLDTSSPPTGRGPPSPGRWPETAWRRRCPTIPAGSAASRRWTPAWCCSPTTLPRSGRPADLGGQPRRLTTSRAFAPSRGATQASPGVQPLASTARRPAR